MRAGNTCLTMILVTSLIGCANPRGTKLVRTYLAGESSSGLFSEQLQSEVQHLARDLLAQGKDEGSFSTRLRLQTLTGDYKEALQTLSELRASQPSRELIPQRFVDFQYELYVRAKLVQQEDNVKIDGSFHAAMELVFRGLFERFDNEEAYWGIHYARRPMEQIEATTRQTLSRLRNANEWSTEQALALCELYQDYRVHEALLPPSRLLIEEDSRKRFLVDREVLIEAHDGALLSAVVVRSRSKQAKEPTALIYTIYNNEPANFRKALHAAAHGYVGIVADARGKRLGTGKITPYEAEAQDVNAVIDWVARQPWSDGQVAMYGGSYDGFSQWAATKHLHPALKTIVPYVAAIPGQGLPMENNVFLNANYAWAFYVSNNRSLDFDTYAQQQRWRDLNFNWYASGRAYREFDRVDGIENPWLQRWLSHPGYDEYWQAMVPYRDDFSKINIPVLSITGYYDDGQISALRYFRQHHEYNTQADHYLLIGPYDHLSAQRRTGAELRGYRTDPVSYVDTPELTFQWLDHILKGGKRPELVRDKVNFQLMGDNRWRHAPSLAGLNADAQRLYLTNEESGRYYSLTEQAAAEPGSLRQVIDLADRDSMHNDYYPWPIVRDHLEVSSGLAFVSKPMPIDMELAGQFSGQLSIQINKRDVDLGVVLYELKPDGQFFHLSYYLGRASYAQNMAKRRLLKPNHVESIPFHRTRMVAKRIRKGSRLLAVLDVNKNAFAQVNYGTGGDVSDETIADADIPLEVLWHNTSYIDVPMRPLQDAK